MYYRGICLERLSKNANKPQISRCPFLRFESHTSRMSLEPWHCIIPGETGHAARCRSCLWLTHGKVEIQDGQKAFLKKKMWSQLVSSGYLGLRRNLIRRRQGRRFESAGSVTIHKHVWLSTSIFEPVSYGTQVTVNGLHSDWLQRPYFPLGLPTRKYAETMKKLEDYFLLKYDTV
jgi:hypothetical protein